MAPDFEKLYNTYFMQVYSFLLTLTKSQDMSEEITQKTFFKAMSARGKYRSESSEFTWLCAIAKNLYVDELRAQKRTRELDATETLSTSAEDAFVTKNLAFKAHEALHELEEPYKEVFQLRVFGELSFKEIGALFSRNETWARVTHHRARLKIQERMKDS